MLMRIYIPPPPLSFAVDYFWYMEGYNAAQAKERTLPDGCIDLIMNLYEDCLVFFDCEQREIRLNGTAIIGPHTSHYYIDTTGESKVAGIRLKPGGLFPFASISVEETVNRHLTIGDVWGTAAVEIRERLLYCRGPEPVFRTLEHWLMSRVVRNWETHSPVQFLLDRLPQGHDIGKIIEQTGYSHRHMNTLFKQQVGLTPKRISRLHRFQQALRQMSGESGKDWVRIALDCGYFDQAHFIRDFHSFTGMTPGEYRKIEGRDYRHAASSE